jgi:hypothetical protein
MDMSIYNISNYTRCICGWKYGKGVGVQSVNHQNRHCFNSMCENSFHQVHPNGYDINNCCYIEDEGINE